MSKAKDSARYAKIISWSDEDGCYIGSAPGLLIGGCHGDDEKAVFDELCQVVEEATAENRPVMRSAGGAWRGHFPDKPCAPV